ncbi:uncharacterized protein KY384_007849 [Bacidia gigantensis]|uniref:uncharacterized protein n=1 Tax=Bacidia gigantensis TaxID=2732470 RepID=UPI001D04D01C|nr:uncharacterized protein KY384_007849 [Bacidia gigantensis]KAG8527695.1 hypothetical protein KY384_007849 [Bacidia gigantensis]
MAELSLASLALFLPALDSCNRLHAGYKKTKSFGEDLGIIGVQLEAQRIRLEQVAKRRLGELYDARSIDFNDESNPTLQMALRCLGVIRHHFEECGRLLKIYSDKGPDSPSLREQSASKAMNGPAPNSSVSKTSPKPDKASKIPFRKKLAVSVWKKKKTPQEETQTSSNDLVESQNTQGQSTSILNNASVANESERQSQKALSVQKSTTIFRRIQWAKTDRAKLRKIVEELRTVITELEGLFQTRVDSKASFLLQQTPETNPFFQSCEDVQESLFRLHKSLMQVRSSQEHRDPHLLGFQLREDSTANRSDLENEPYVRLRTNSTIFNFQQKTSSNSTSESRLLLVDTLLHLQDEASTDAEPTLNLPLPLKRMSCLSRPNELAETELDQNVETWGYIHSHDSSHIIHHDRVGQWKNLCNLTDMLSHPSYLENIKPQQITQLVKLLLISRLQLSSVTNLLETLPNISQYQYFCDPTDDPEEWNHEDPLILKPWLCHGFGTRSSKRKLGGGSGVSNQRKASMLEFGLILFQICTGRILDERTGQESTTVEPREQAVKGMDQIDKIAGSSMTDIVQTCVTFDSIADAEGELQGIDEVQFVQRAIMTLMRDERLLEGSRCAPL